MSQINTKDLIEKIEKMKINYFYCDDGFDPPVEYAKHISEIQNKVNQALDQVIELIKNYENKYSKKEMISLINSFDDMLKIPQKYCVKYNTRHNKDIMTGEENPGGRAWVRWFIDQLK